MSAYYKKGKIEPLDLILSQNLNFAAGNVIKYVCRYPHKHRKKQNKLNDLLKARTYLNLLIKEFTGEVPDEESNPGSI